MRTPLLLTIAITTATTLSAATMAGSHAVTSTGHAATLTLPSTSGAEDVAIRLGSKGGGKTWRGAMGDSIKVTYLQRGSERNFTGRLDAYREISRKLATMTVIDESGEARTFVIGDVVSIELVGAGSSDESGATTTTEADPKTTPETEITRQPRANATNDNGFPTGPGEGFDHLPRIFLLPIQGGVGDGTRHNEMKKIGEIADSYGPGQIIVLKVNSPGGLVAEADLIHETLKDLKLRHRLVAWIEEAISAAAYTSFHCNEVYFMKTGALGSATMFAGGTAISGERLRQWVKKFGDVAEESGHPRALAEAMITNSKMVSYDPAEGENGPVVYNTTEGKRVLSTSEENLTINATDAFACGFADGIADNEEELAEQLRLPFWYETTDDGRKIHERWQKTLETAKVEIPRLGMQAQGQTGQTNDPLKNLNRQLVAVNKLIAWARKLGNHTSMMMQLPPIEYLEEAKKTLQEQIRQMKSR